MSEHIDFKHVSGRFGTSNSKIYYVVSVEVMAQYYAESASHLRVEVRAYSTSSSYSVSGTGYCNVSIEGVMYTDNISSSKVIDSSGKVIFSRFVVVNHSNRNSKSLRMTLEVDHTRFLSVVYAHSVTLPRITHEDDKKTLPKYYHTRWIYSECGVYRLATNVSINSQNVANNTTNATFEIIVQRVYAGWTAINGSVYCRIDGMVYGNTLDGVQINNLQKRVFRKTVDIKHNADGTKRLYFASWINHGSFSIKARDFYIDLPPFAHARASSIKSISGTTIGDNMTVNINKGASSFTSTIHLQANGSEWVKIDSVDKNPNSSFTFKIPETLAYYIKTSTKESGKVRVTTYKGNDKIGEVSQDVEFYVPEWMKPEISSVSLYSDTKVSNVSMWVKDKSRMKAKVNIDYSKLYGASITSCKVRFQGVDYGSDVWSSVIRSNGNLPVKITVKDSRGRTATVDRIISASDYSAPTCQLSGFRCNSSGIRDDIAGKNAKIIYKGTVSDLNGKNSMAMNISYRPVGGAWKSCSIGSYSSGREYAIMLPVTLDEDKAYDIKIEVSDVYTTVSRIIRIAPCFVLLDFKPGGKSLAVGRPASTDYCIDLGVSLKFYDAEKTIKHNDNKGYMYFTDRYLGIYDSSSGEVFSWDSTGSVLKSRATTTISDARLKYDIDEFTNWEDYYNFYMSLKPKTFKYNNDTKERTSIGLIAQEVADSIVDNNLMNEKLQLVNVTENKDMEDGREYSLSYQDLIALNMKMIQKHEEEIKALKDKIDK